MAGSPRPRGAYGLSAVGQLFSRESQAIFFNWWVLGGAARVGLLLLLAPVLAAAAALLPPPARRHMGAPLHTPQEAAAGAAHAGL